MVQEENKENQELIEVLQKRLDWFCFEAKESEINTEEIDAIINLMDTLKPLPRDNFFDASVSYNRFMEKYVDNPEMTEEGERIQELIGQLAGDTGIGGRIVGRVADLCHSRAFQRSMVAAAAVVIMFLGVNIGTYATTKMGFFDYITLTGSEQRFFVTGEEVDFSEPDVYTIEYDSVDELEEQYDDILFPQSIPENMLLTNVELKKAGDTDQIFIKYIEPGKEDARLMFLIHKYYETGWHILGNSETQFISKEMIGDKEVSFYTYKEDDIMACFFHGRAMYKIWSSISMEELIECINNMS